MKRHILILLAITIVTQGILFISYPLGDVSGEDNQAAQQFLMGEITRGNLLVGNLRYNTGYAFALAPVYAVSQIFDRLDDRVFMLVQILLASTIPFLAYDIIRRRRNIREAFIVALVVALDPFGLQWTHFLLPGWLIAFLTILALWLIQLGILRKRWFTWVGLAGLVMGIATVARLNFAPTVAALGFSFFLLTIFTWRRRTLMFMLFGICSAGVLLAYLLFIQIPSTGTISASCVTGTNLLNSVMNMNIPIESANGEATENYLGMLAIDAEPAPSFYTNAYPFWRIPDSWAGEAERLNFLNQPKGETQSSTTVTFPGNLYYYLGPCETDALLRQVHHEAFVTHTGEWLTGVLKSSLFMIIQQVQNVIYLDEQYLPMPAQIEWGETLSAGFRVADGGYYNGQVVWEPGIQLFSGLFPIWNLIKLLTPFAVIWAFWSRDWLYIAVTLMLLTTIGTITLFTQPEPRYFALVYPLYSILIGGLLASLLSWLKHRFASTNESV